MRARHRVGLGDYEQIDIVMQQLRDRIGITYRIAYLTGMERSFGDFLQCKVYGGQALLYNPTRLINVTAATTSPTLSHDQIDGLQATPHLRRSLPLCDRGTHPVMPLETLIDGAPQTDKCGRQTPSGPVWSVLRREGHIAATAVRLAYVADPSSVIDVFNVNPTAEQEVEELPIIRKLIAAMPAPQTEGRKRYYPPLLVGDLNATRVPDYPGFDLVMETPPEDFIRVGIGQEGGYPARFKASFRDGFIIPDLPPGVSCAGTPDILISDHCALLVRFTPAPAADALRAVSIEGPGGASTGSRYHLGAIATGGGGRTLSYVWQPGGATTEAIDPVAGAPGTTQTWQVTVSDPNGGSFTANHSVGFFPDITPCLNGCAQARDDCMAAVASGGGGPRPQACTAGYNACAGQCRK